MTLSFFHEDNKVSLRRLIAFLWSLVVFMLFLLAFAFGKQVPDGTVPITVFVWGFYFAKKASLLNNGKDKE